MADVNSLKQRINQLLVELGRQSLHSLYPNDFEYYIVALELVNVQTGRTEDLFYFPITPNVINTSRSYMNNLEKTSSGITSISNSTFTIKPINLTGNFGRRLKVIVGNDVITLPTIGGSLGYLEGQIDMRIKTGYGCTKYLEKLIEKSQSQNPENSGTYRLIYYNMSFNESFIVKPVSLNFNISREGMNAIWSYNLTLNAVAPANKIQNGIDSKDIKKIMDSGTTQKIINDNVKGLSNITKGIPKGF